MILGAGFVDCINSHAGWGQPLAEKNTIDMTRLHPIFLQWRFRFDSILTCDLFWSLIFDGCDAFAPLKSLILINIHHSDFAEIASSLIFFLECLS